MSLPRPSAPVNRRISLVLIDDNRSSREGVAALIRGQPGFHILATSANTEEALRAVRETAPDIVLLNLGPEGDDRVLLAGALHGQAPESRVIIMDLEPVQADVVSLVRAGVSGFIMAGASLDRLLRTIHSVAQGTQVLPLELTRLLFGQLNRQGVRGGPKRAPKVKRLTNRESEVAELIVQGLSNKEIADRLRIAPHTVKSHVHKVLSKLAVNSRLEVAAFSRPEPVPAMIPLAVGPASRDPELVPSM